MVGGFKKTHLVVKAEWATALWNPPKNQMQRNVNLELKMEKAIIDINKKLYPNF